MEAGGEPGQEDGGIAGVLAKLEECDARFLQRVEALGCSQDRMEAMLAKVQRDLGALSLHLNQGLEDDSLPQPPIPSSGPQERSSGEMTEGMEAPEHAQHELGVDSLDQPLSSQPGLQSIFLEDVSMCRDLSVATSSSLVKSALKRSHHHDGSISMQPDSFGQRLSLPPESHQCLEDSSFQKQVSPDETPMGKQSSWVAACSRFNAALEHSHCEHGEAGLSSTPEALTELPASLPPGWPASMQSKWIGGGVLQSSPPARRHDCPNASRSRTPNFYANEIGCNISRGRGWMQRIIVDPNSAAYSVYSMFGLLVLVHDVLYIPFAFAWNLQMAGISATASWISCCFWTADVGMSLITGYSLGGKLEMRPSYVAWRYATTWLVPDVLVNTCDWVGMVISLGDEDSKASIQLIRFLKLGKLFRLIGMIRMTKAIRMLEDAVENRFTGVFQLLLVLFMFAWSLFLLTHLIGCGWYAIGRLAPSDTGMRWINMPMEWNGEELYFSDFELHQQYLSAVQYIMAQIVGGNIDITAYNTWEQIYNMLCMAVGLLFGATIVSMLSFSMVEYQRSKSDQTQKIRQLRRFLVENNISRVTATLARQEASARLSMRSKLQEKDVHALECLSTSLRSTIRYERFSEHLSRHALFRLWMNLDTYMVRELCIKAIDSAMLAPQDYLFEPGFTCSNAYCLIEGQVIYTQDPVTAPVDDICTTSVEVGRWICEAALWSHWVHVGKATARTYAQVVSIGSDSMMEVLQRHSLVAEVTAEYCRHFHRCIVTARPPDASWPTDLEVPLTEFSDLVVGMDSRAQVTIGLSALEQHGSCRKPLFTSKRDSMGDLRDEVYKGKSCVLMNAEGEIQRVVSLAVVEIKSRHGKVFVELGKMEGGTDFSCSCQLPAMKQAAGELISATLARLLARFRLKPEDFELVSVSRDAECKNSAEFGVFTKYTRTTYHVELLRDIPMLEMEITRSRHVIRQSDNSKGSSPFTLLLGPVYKVDTGDKSVLYTWLDPEGFRHLRSSAGVQQLNKWMLSLEEPELEIMTI